MEAKKSDDGWVFTKTSSKTLPSRQVVVRMSDVITELMILDGTEFAPGLRQRIILALAKCGIEYPPI